MLASALPRKQWMLVFVIVALIMAALTATVAIMPVPHAGSTDVPTYEVISNDLAQAHEATLKGGHACGHCKSHTTSALPSAISVDAVVLYGLADWRISSVFSLSKIISPPSRPPRNMVARSVLISAAI